MTKRIIAHQCVGVMIDVQSFFLAQTQARLRPKLKANIKNFTRLIGYFEIPLLVTLERPVAQKGILPKEIGKHLNDRAAIFEKDFFDLTKERPIRDHLVGLKKTQAIVAGCETDVCVLQSCLGLLALGYEVFVVEDVLFSSAQHVDAAIARLRGEGAVLLSYKSLYYELIEAVGGSRHIDDMLAAFGPFPEDLPDCAV